MTERLAIVGSTCALFADAAPIIRDVIFKYAPESIVGGGAIGIDSYASAIARLEFALPVIECHPAKPEWIYFKARNLIIADLCTRLVRIVSSRATTYGSGWTRDRAAELGKPVEEYVIG